MIPTNSPYHSAEHFVPFRSLVEPTGLVESLTEIVGGSWVLSGEVDRERYAQTTLPRGTTPSLVVLPQTVEQVAKVVQTLSRLGLEWKAISRGKNWGYGDACAPHNGAVILDLQRMNRVIEVNEELGYAVIEPGVTQGQLADLLKESKSSLMLDVTGAGRDASIVGNILQRGFGHTPYGDRVSNSCNYQYVNRDGTIKHTGFGGITGSVIGHVYPYGKGPNEQGMLAQSQEFVITRMTVWLMPRPESIVGFGFKTDSDAAFAEIINRIGKLRQSSTLNSVIHLANDLRVLSTQPWLNEYDRSNGFFNEQQRALMRKRAGIGRWNALGGLFGSRHEILAKKKTIQAALDALCQPRFFGKMHIRALRWIAERLPRWSAFDQSRNLISSVSDVYDLLSGTPSNNHLQGAFFGNRPASGEVIDAGLIWIAPVVPMCGHEILQLIQEIEKTANAYGFDLPVTISPVVARAAVCIANLSFDKYSQSEFAKRCYAEISQTIERMNYPTYRNSSVAMP